MSQPLLICTDLDRTLLPNGDAPESTAARPAFGALAAHAGTTVAYVSGRHLALVEAAIDEYRLPVPDYVIADVGTTIYVREDGHWRRDEDWDARLAQDWRGEGHAGLVRRLAAVETLELQEDARQGLHKLSYYLPQDTNFKHVDGEIGAALSGVKVRARRIYSVDDLDGRGLLDVVPDSASKYHAIRALMRSGSFGLHNTVFCGDSGNDLDVLASPLDAVLVGNATRDVRGQALALAAARGHSERLYIAAGDFHGMNGNYSAGMLEGIAHYHPHTVDWMQLDASTPARDAS